MGLHGLEQGYLYLIYIYICIGPRGTSVSRWLHYGVCRVQPPAHEDSSVPDFSTQKGEEISFSETSVHTRSTQRHIPEDVILQFSSYLFTYQLHSPKTNHKVSSIWKETNHINTTTTVQTGSGVHPISYTMGTGGSFPGVKRPERETLPFATTTTTTTTNNNNNSDISVHEYFQCYTLPE
jgi:hypothetical protein